MKSIFEICKKYLKENRKDLIIYGMLCFITSIFSMISPYISGNFIDYLIIADNVNIIYKYCLIFLGITIFNQIIGYFANRLYTKLQTKMGFELNKDVISHIQKLPLSYIKDKDIAYMNQRINNDSNMLVTFCINIFQGILINSLKLTLSIILLLTFDKIITILLIMIIGLYALIYKMLKKILFEMKFALTEAQAKYFAKLYEQLLNIIFIKTQAIYKEFTERLKKSFDNIFKTNLKYQKVTYAFSTLDSLVMSIAQIGIFIIGGISVIKGNISIGQLTIMFSYFGVMMESARYFFLLTKTIQDNKVAYVRLKNILDEDKDENSGVELEDINQIEIKNLAFSYSKKPIFQNFSKIFQKGKIYCIIGHNGRGKSTLVNLILGFYRKEYTGNIYYNNIPLQNIDCYKARKRCFAISEQELTLLFDTIKYNILLDEEKKIDLKKIFHIAQQINFDSFLKNLPEGVHTVINEKNSNLSGGEKQKISILRTLYKNSPVIILDEPTSALDEKSIECLQRYLMQIKKEKIILIITHNPECLSIADEIIDLDKN